MREQVGIRELKNGLSSILRRVRRGEIITVTHRDRPVAVIVPAAAGETDQVLKELVKAGRLSWSGGKPVGCTSPPRVRGPSVSEAVIEDRR
jgi:prevent-host-death family protein